MPKVISVHSYRGGTGKSNFTANIAASVAMQGYRVAVVDTDVPSPGIHNILGLDPSMTTQTLNTYLWGDCAIEDAAYDVSQSVGISHPNGKLFLVPASIKTDHIARILQNGYDVRLLNDGFRKLVKNLNLDYLFIDTHPGLSKETFLTIAISHHLLLILRPDKQDYQGTAVTMDVARQLNVKNMFLVINKALSTMNLDVLRQKVEETYELPVAGVFRLSEDVARLASEGIFCMNYPEHEITQEFQSVARRIME